MNASLKAAERAAPSVISPQPHPSSLPRHRLRDTNDVLSFANGTATIPTSKPLNSMTPSNQAQASAPKSAHQAALRGASLAFGKPKPPVKPKPTVSLAKDHTGRNGALAAATVSLENAGRGPNGASPGQGSSVLSHGTGNGRTRARSPTQVALSHQRTGEGFAVGQNTGNSERGGMRSVGGSRGSLAFDGSSHLQLPSGSTQGVSPRKSASFIAATLAAERERSRSREVTPNHTGLQSGGQGQTSRAALREQLQRSSSFTRTEVMESRRDDRARGLRMVNGTDTTSIPATTSLIQMFEQQQRIEKAVTARLDETTSRSHPVHGQKQKAPLVVRARTPPRTPGKSPKSDIRTPKPTQAQSSQDPPPSRGIQMTKNPITASKPILIPPRRQSQNAISPDDVSSSNDSFVSASSHRPSTRTTLQNRAPSHRLTSKSKSTPSSYTALDSLANAIVASSLASSRAASPSKSNYDHHQNQITKAPLPPPRLSRIFHNRPSPSRTPSPAKPPGLRATMRKPHSPSPTKAANPPHPSKKSHYLKKHHHPHKHSEGTRRHWHSTITPPERKRYEAVWASNKGLLQHPSFPAGSEDSVCNLVVRDIWSRSRLPSEVLEEVYELVDRGRTGWLGREEFVVGMWLVDGWLGGRKVPLRVGGSVWGSVRG